jgi:hypothetical protein
MHSVAAKVAIEILMFLKDRDVYAGASQKIAQHHTGRSAPNNTACCFQPLCRHAVSSSVIEMSLGSAG